MTEPTVAVVMPLYNVEDFVDEAFDGIAGQTRQANEIIVVDDASSDCTVERVRSWADRLPLTLIELEKNVGCGVARSIAIREASADIVAPHDGDDVWLPHHLASLVPLVSPKTIAAARPLLWSGDASDPGQPGWHEIPPADQQADIILAMNFLFSGSLYQRSTLLDLAGGPSEKRLAEDRETWIRLICRAKCHAVAADGPTVRYRQRGDSLSADEGCLDGVVEILQECSEDPTFPANPVTLDRALRRWRSRRRFLQALDLAENGHPWQARRALLEAAIEDRTLRGGTAPAELGSVTLRAAAAFPSPRTAAAKRKTRLGRSGAFLGGG